MTAACGARHLRPIPAVAVATHGIFPSQRVRDFALQALLEDQPGPQGAQASGRRSLSSPRPSISSFSRSRVRSDAGIECFFVSRSTPTSVVSDSLIRATVHPNPFHNPRTRAEVRSNSGGQVQRPFPISRRYGASQLIIAHPAEWIGDLLMNISSRQYQLLAACNCHRSERCPIIDANLLVNVMEVNLHGTL